MHVLVTGASGFIGSLVCKEFLKQGNSVTGISRSGKSPLDSSIDMHACDLTSNEDTCKTLEGIKQIKQIDCIVHLAGLTFTRKEPAPGAHDYFENNFSSTLNLLECCRLYSIKRFVFSSSIAVYGLAAGQHSPRYLPVDEKHEARPYEFYDASKYYAEELCKYYQDRFKISCAVLRYSRVYGPGQDKGIIYQAIAKSLNSQPIDVKGDISTDFVYVDDVVNATISACKLLMQGHDESHLDLATDKSNIFNIGSGVEIKLYDLCANIVKLTGSHSELRHAIKPCARFALDISKAQKLLNYKPISLEEGLIKSISYIRNSLK